MALRSLFGDEDGAADGGCFLAVETAAFSPEKLMALSPRLMRWSGTVTLVDLSPCMTYWTLVAERQGTSPADLWRRLLAEACGGEDGRGHRAASAAHPWQALLLLGLMEERALHGFLEGTSPLGEAVLRALSWDVFWRRVTEIEEHLLGHSLAGGGTLKKSKMAGLRQQRAHLERVVHKLAAPTPRALAHLSPAGILRRFGPALHAIWQWTMAGGDAADAGAFPWRHHHLHEPPAVRRHLDHGVWEWEAIEPMLAEDLNRLCGHPQWRGKERVVSLEWCLVFHDLSSLVIPIRFRYPHSLHSEMPQQKTALLQACYSFGDRAASAAAAAAAGHEPLPEPIVSWTLTAVERLALPPVGWDLFGAASGERDALAQLENRLAVALRSYACRPDWLPEDSYGEPGVTLAEAHALTQMALGVRRPLFLYEKPFRLSEGPYSKALLFLERTMGKWWRPGESRQRDYYMLVEQRRRHGSRRLWAYRDHEGRWLVHGVFA